MTYRKAAKVVQRVLVYTFAQFPLILKSYITTVHLSK